MDHIDEMLTEEIRKYVHLYDSSSPHYKDSQMTATSWKEISTNIGLDVIECTKRWKNLRDKYVRLRKRQAARSGKKVPAFYSYLSWLSPHIKHRDTESNYDNNKPSPQSPSLRMAQKRKRREHVDLLQNQVAQLEDQRVELQQTLLQNNDELSRFGQTAADMMRRLPEEHRAQAMFDVYKLLFERQQQYK